MTDISVQTRTAKAKSRDGNFYPDLLLAFCRFLKNPPSGLVSGLHQPHLIAQGPTIVIGFGGHLGRLSPEVLRLHPWQAAQPIVEAIANALLGNLLELRLQTKTWLQTISPHRCPNCGTFSNCGPGLEIFELRWPTTFIKLTLTIFISKTDTRRTLQGRQWIILKPHYMLSSKGHLFPKKRYPSVKEESLEFRLTTCKNLIATHKDRYLVRIW